MYLRDSENMGGIVEAISIPQSGTFKFALPTQILQSLIDMTGLNNVANAQDYKFLLLTDGATISVSAEDGTELPKGLTYSPASREFTVSNLSEVTLPIVVMVTITRQGKVVITKINSLALITISKGNQLTNKIPNILGGQLKNAREKAGLSLESVAKTSTLSNKQLEEIESGGDSSLYLGN